MRRRLILLAAVVPFALPLAVGLATHGCSDEPPFESACSWLADPNNCLRQFHEDVLSVAGETDNPTGDCRTWTPGTPAALIPTQASAGAPGVSNGSFQMRAMLDTCLLDQGGQVTVDPPIDLTMYPPTPFADPITYTLTFVNTDGNPCGQATYSSPHGFSITINPPPDAGSTDMADAGVDAPPPPSSLDSGVPVLDGGSFYTSGTYTQVNPPGRDSFDVTCPSGEAHHLSLDEIDFTTPSAGSCPAVAAILPSASLQIYPGGVDTAGAVSFAIVYPPLGDTPYVDGGTLTPATVVYFNCQIPGAAETCMDGAKDGTETDIDCGGPQNPSKEFCGMCPAPCEVGQNCLCDGDCDDSMGLVCTVNAGLRQCGPKVVDGGTVEHFPCMNRVAPVCSSTSSSSSSSG